MAKRTAKAAVYDEPNTPFEIRNYPMRDVRSDSLSVGDRITWTEYFHHGESYYRDVHDMPQKSNGVRKYGHDLVEEDPHFLGDFAEYCYVVPGTGILKLPDELSDEEATPINCGCHNGFRDRSLGNRHG